MMVDILECPVCKGKKLKNFVSPIDHTVSHKEFNIKQCSVCTIGITTPRPDESKLGSYYQSEEYISHSGKTSGGIGLLYKIARSFSLQWKKRIVKKSSQKGSILDFGCGTGEFLNTVQKESWLINGIEPSDLARTKAQRLTGQNIYKELRDLPDIKYDAITAWHVLEHVPNIIETMKILGSLLNKDGTLFIAVPNYQSPDSENYKSYWAGYDVPRHLWHFSKQSMLALLKISGLKLIKIVPMKLDSYYISLLSEKYQNKNSLNLACLLKAIIWGLKSNLRARKGTNHSSLIYIVRNS